MENLLGDVDRARAIFDIAIHQPALDMPEVVILILYGTVHLLDFVEVLHRL